MEKDETYYGEKEALWQFVQEEQQKSAQDYYIFGHRHLPLDLKLEDGARYVNLGDWVFYNTYGELRNGQLELKEFTETAEASSTNPSND